MNTLALHVRRFAHEHDELPAFHAAYLVLAFLSALIFNLGAFGLIIVAHMALDVVKYREYHGLSWKLTWKGVWKESLVDVTLLLVGLVFSIYLHHSVGVASVSALMRVEISFIRTAAMLVPKLKILHHFLKVIAHLRHYLDQIHPRLREDWSRLDYLCFYFCGFSLLLIIFAPPLMGVPAHEIHDILAKELIPWRL